MTLSWLSAWNTSRAGSVTCSGNVGGSDGPGLPALRALPADRPAHHTLLGRTIRPIEGLPLGDDEYQFCKQFVIETALHLAELDFDLDLLGFYRGRPLRVALPELATPPEAQPGA